MPVAVVFLLRAVVLVLLWGFVVAAIVAVRHDVFGTKGDARRSARRAAQPPLAPQSLAVGVPAPAPPAVAAPAKPKRKRRGPAVATKVVVIEGPSTGTTVALSSLPVTIGRAGASSVVLSDDYVSSRHAQLIPRGQEWLVEDSGSTNGTFLDEVKVTAPVVVPVGARIRIGTNVLELRE